MRVLLCAPSTETHRISRHNTLETIVTTRLINGVFAETQSTLRAAHRGPQSLVAQRNLRSLRRAQRAL